AAVTDAVKVFEARVSERAGASATPASSEVDANAPVVQVVNTILTQAVREGASDVHIEPMGERVRVRNRIDGALHEVLSLPQSMAQALVSRIKIMADMNIVERRRPQDGQIETVVDGSELDIRVSTTSTQYGEKTVLRILDKARALYDLSTLGMPSDTSSLYADIIRSPYGMVVCAGPTGSGKTTTLYASLMAINSDEINVMTVEDRSSTRSRRSTRSASTSRPASPSPPVCARSCARTPMPSWWARSETWRRPGSRSRPRSPATSSCRRSTPPTPPAPCTGSWTWASSRSCWRRRCWRWSASAWCAGRAWSASSPTSHRPRTWRSTSAAVASPRTSSCTAWAARCARARATRAAPACTRCCT
ncbi:MAG: Flp pilus assembly complex ATPase component TadA, partial [Acidimicrobiales bacterium]|nr:Flp pilus assembly complex ATPase component TadA [Acidimicrobiales bacterium]